MRKPSKEAKKAARIEYWRELIARQAASGMAVQRFCKEHGLTEQSFYAWRKRLKKEQPMQFVLVQSGPVAQPPVQDPVMEVVLKTGERLRIGVGVNAGALRLVLEALRA
jgi:transposase-like protein